MNKLKENNIPLKNELINKYHSAGQILKININNNYINVLTPKRYINNININMLEPKQAKCLAIKIFNQYHKTRIFLNNKNAIMVSNSGINESIQKIFFNRKQQKYLKEHLCIFSSLGKIIETSVLVNQVKERKNREKYNYWNYYLNNIIINGIKFSIEIDVVSECNGNNNFRMHRLLIKDKTDVLNGDSS